MHLDRNLVVIDVETSGTDTDAASIIQLGAVKFTKEGYLEETIFSEYVKPYTSLWDEAAYKVHQISKDFLEKTGIPIEVALKRFEDWISTTRSIRNHFYLAHWSAGFDSLMLRKAYELAGRKFPFIRRTYDIASIVRFYLAARDKLDKHSSVGTCAALLGIEVNRSRLHDAGYDAWLAGMCLVKVAEEIGRYGENKD